MSRAVCSRDGKRGSARITCITIIEKVERLTGIAVVALPSREAYTLSGRAAAVMAEIVVPGPAQVLAALPVVMGHAGHPVLVHHLRVSAPVLVLGPVGTHVQPLLRGQPRYQYLLCKETKRFAS